MKDKYYKGTNKSSKKMRKAQKRVGKKVEHREISDMIGKII